MDVPDERGLASSLDPSAADATVSEIRIPAIPSRRRLFAIAVLAGLLGLGITLSFGYADHDPQASRCSSGSGRHTRSGSRVASAQTRRLVGSGLASILWQLLLGCFPAAAVGISARASRMDGHPRRSHARIGLTRNH
jgi:hypothetical protein